MSQAGVLAENGGHGGSDVTQIDADTGSAFPLAGIINIFGGTGISTSATGDTVTITATGSSGFTWNTVTSATNPNQIVANNGYICAGVSQVSFILPLVPTIGDTFRILSYTSKFQITENGSQSIRLGGQITTSGSGTVTSNTAGDTVEIIYIGSNVFMAMSPQGSLTTS